MNFENLEKIAKRFQGLSVDYRRGGTEWPQPWRIRVYASKDSNSEYRLTVYGDTLDEAFEKLAQEWEALSDKAKAELNQ